MTFHQLAPPFCLGITWNNHILWRIPQNPKTHQSPMGQTSTTWRQGHSCHPTFLPISSVLKSGETFESWQGIMEHHRTNLGVVFWWSAATDSRSFQDLKWHKPQQFHTRLLDCLLQTRSWHTKRVYLYRKKRGSDACENVHRLTSSGSKTNK